MKVLLHICCGPCLIYPAARLREQGYEVTGFFYNPNIHGYGEYTQRRDAVRECSKALGLDVVYADYAPEEFFRAVHMKESSPERCSLCWGLRLARTARAAKEEGFTFFSTTLLVSPYQDHESLKTIGRDSAGQEAVDFYYEDFRPGFRAAHDQAKAQGIYCQKYCGCVYSEIERYSKKNKHMSA